MLNRFDDRYGRRWPALPTLLVLVVALAGCQKVAPAAVAAEASVGQGHGERRAAAGDVALDTAGIAGVDPLANDADRSLPLPDDFPGDVYRPHRYQVNTVLDMGGTETVSMTAPGRVTSLFADARRAMQAQGWTQTLAAQHSVDNAVLAFEKERRSATLSFNKVQGNGVLVSVQLQDNQ